MTRISYYKNKPDLIDLYRTFLKKMILIREFEKTIYSIFKDSPISRYIHLSIGQEAIAVGAIAAITYEDYITLTYRNHAHLIARGADINKIAAEIFGKKTGYCQGKGGSMHSVIPSLNIIDSNGIVGAGIPIAAGAALSLLLNKRKSVILCFFGDGASNQGVFHETLNISSLWKLPIVFICENNGYSISVPTSKSTCVKNISIRAKAYDMPGQTIDGNNILKVYETINKSVDRARNGSGPSLIECKTYSTYGHYIGEDLEYRSPEEIKFWRLRDPILTFEKKLMKDNIVNSLTIDKIRKGVVLRVKQAIKYAQKSTFPNKYETYKGIYAV